MKKTFVTAKASACAFAMLPAIAGAAPPPLDAYGDLPSVEDIAIAPGGNNIATVAKLHGERRLIVVDPAGKVSANAPIGDTKLRGLEWAGDEIVLVSTSATTSLGPMFTASKYELAGTIIVPLNGGKSQLVFSRTESIGDTTRGRYGIRNIGGVWKGYYAALRSICR